MCYYGWYIRYAIRIILFLKQVTRKIAFILFIAVIGYAATDNVVEKQLEDFAAFNDTLLQKEGKIDLHVSEKVIQSSLKDLRIHLQTERSLLEQFKLFSSTLAKIQCGHTQIYPNKAILRAWLAERNTLPLDYYLEGKRLIVNKIDANDYKNIYEGLSYYQRKKRIEQNSEILSIDHLTIDEMMQDIGLYISSDENLDEFKYFQAAQLFEFYRHLSHPFDKDSIHVKYVTNTDTNEVYLLTGTAPVYTMNDRLMKVSMESKSAASSFGEFKIIKSKYGYFRFESFSAAYGKNYDEFIQSSFEKLKQKKIDKLVIDLRGNMGGVMQYKLMRYFVGEGVNLGRYVVEKPKQHDDSKYIKKFHSEYAKHRRMSKKQKKLKRRDKFNNGQIATTAIDTNLVFMGSVVVITDEGTFSSAAMLACHLKTLRNAKIVGRTSGGSFYIGNAGTLEVKLPANGLQLYVNPNTFYSHLEITEDTRKIKIPDLEINPIHMSKSKMDAHYFKAATSLFQ